MEDKWFDEFMLKANSGIFVRSGSETILVQITNELKNFLLLNRLRIVKVGQALFKEFLSLVSEGKEQEGLLQIYGQLDYDDLISKYQSNALQLEQIVREANEARIFWLDMIKQLGGKLISLALTTLL